MLIDDANIKEARHRLATLQVDIATKPVNVLIEKMVECVVFATLLYERDNRQAQRAADRLMERACAYMDGAIVLSLALYEQGIETGTEGIVSAEYQRLRRFVEKESERRGYDAAEVLTYVDEYSKYARDALVASQETERERKSRERQEQNLLDTSTDE